MLGLKPWGPPGCVPLSGCFVLPRVVYSQVLGDCTFCLIMLETDGHLSCYSLWRGADNKNYVGFKLCLVKEVEMNKAVLL